MLLSILLFVLWVLFFLSSFILIVVVLLQESKGGGLAEAFGGTGAETFGVRAGGINRFTFIIAAVFILSSVLIFPVSRWARPVVVNIPSKVETPPTTPAIPTQAPSSPTPGAGGPVKVPEKKQ